MRRTILLATVVVLTAGLGACADDDTDVGTGGTTPTMPTREPDLTGTITKVTPFEPVTEDCVPLDDVDPDDPVSSDDPPICTPEDSDILGTVLLEEDTRPNEGRKISYTVTSDTAMAGSFDDLAEGQTADTWTTGACAESYPEQCGLEAIRITG